MVEMDLVGVRVELPSNTPIALLRERSGARRVLPIFIGGPEATAIAFALEEVVTPRPMTHDLMRNVLEDLGVSIESVVVTELRDRTFYAEIELHAADGVHRISSRPSDAIALAIRVGTPIFASEQVLDEAGFEAEDEAEGDEEEPGEEAEVVEQFREFIDSVNPDDFAS
jgi:bifunctional DNase/RNase